MELSGKKLLIDIVVFIIAAIAVYYLFIYAPAVLKPDIVTENITIHVSERFPTTRLSSSYVITEENIRYDLCSQSLFQKLQPGHNYTVTQSRVAGSNYTACISEITSKDN